MPIYEYKCDLCNGMWEEIQKFSDEPLTICTSCEKEGGVHKIVSRTSFVLKGENWSNDGYSAPPPGTIIGTKTVSGIGDKITGVQEKRMKGIPPASGEGNS